MILQNCWLKETKVVKYKRRLLWQLLSLMWVEMKLRYGDGEVPKFANAPKSYDILARILNMMWFERQLFLHQRISIFAQIFQIKKIKKILKFMCSMRVFVCLFFNFFLWSIFFHMGSMSIIVLDFNVFVTSYFFIHQLMVGDCFIHNQKYKDISKTFERLEINLKFKVNVKNQCVKKYLIYKILEYFDPISFSNTNWLI